MNRKMGLIHLSMRQLKLDTTCCNTVRHVAMREEVLRQIEAMMIKESTNSYRVSNHILAHKKDREVISRSLSNEKVVSAQEFVVDEICRQKMCEWSYRVIDHFNGRREIVAIAQNFVDRFLNQYQCDCTAYKLVSITSLYLAVKVHNQKLFSVTSLANLSRGEFLVEDITDMENMLLKALDWQLCPPTAASFCGHFYFLLQPSVKSSVRRTILQRSCFFCELGVMDCSLMMSGVNQSEIAFAALLNSMAGVSSALFSDEDKNEFVGVIERCSGINAESNCLKMVQEALWVLYHQSTQFNTFDSCKVTRVNRTIKDRSVSRTMNNHATNESKKTEKDIVKDSFRQLVEFPANTGIISKTEDIVNNCVDMSQTIEMNGYRYCSNE